MPSKYQALIALWLFQIVNYLDRTSISFAGPTMMKSLGLNPQDFGTILSVFAVGYFAAQLPGGWLADRFGAKIMFVLVPLLWAACTGGVYFVAGLAGLIVARLCLGMAEGIGNSAIFKFIGDTFSSNERARVSGIWATSFAAAPALGGPLIAFLLIQFDWRVTFVVLAAPALGVALLNYAVIPATPAARPPARGVAAAATPFSALLRQPGLWLVALTYFFFNFGYWGYLGWMPSYLASAHHIDLKSVGTVGGVPYVFGIFGLLVLGWLGDTRLYAHRAQLWAASFVLAGVALYFAYQSDTLAGSLAGLSGAAFFLYGSLALFGGILIDYAPSDARARCSAIATTTGQIGGIVAPLVIGYLVTQSGSYASGFAFMIVTLVAAAVSALALRAVRRPASQAASSALPATAA